MKLIKGYPDKIVFQTPLENTVTISCEGEIKIVYVVDGIETVYYIKETKQSKLVMNK